MKTIIVGKLACDDSILKASRNLEAEEIKDVVSAALTFTSFTVAQVSLVYARVSEKYYLACKKLGYDYGFFREHTILALCRLNQYNGSGFDGVYIPFSGEIYLVPSGIFEFAKIPEMQCEAVLRRYQTPHGEVKLSRRFNVNPDTEKQKISSWKKFRAKVSGEMIMEFTEERISSLVAEADVCTKTSEDGEEDEDVKEPMYFLYNNVE